MLEIRHIWVFSVTSNLQTSQNQGSPYVWVCEIHIGLAVILNSKMAASWTVSKSRRKWIEMLEMRHIWAFLVTSNLQICQNQGSPYIQVCKIRIGMAAISNSKMAAYGDKLNWIKGKKKVNWNAWNETYLSLLSYL